jgi:hypothetical protein
LPRGYFVLLAAGFDYSVSLYHFQKRDLLYQTGWLNVKYVKYILDFELFLRFDVRLLYVVYRLTLYLAFC